MKVFLMKFGAVVSVGGTSKQSVKVFPTKIIFSTSLRKLRYTVFTILYDRYHTLQ